MKRIVVGVVEQEGQILIGKKIYVEGHELSEQWHIPGGKVHDTETLEEGAIREIFEETGLKVKVLSMISDTYKEVVDVQLVWFHCAVTGGILKASDDLTKQNSYRKKILQRSVLLTQLLCGLRMQGSGLVLRCSLSFIYCTSYRHLGQYS